MRSRICNGSPRVNGLKSSSIAIPLRSSLLRRSAAKTYVLKSVTEDIKEKIPYVAFDYEQEVETAKSSSAIKVTYELPNVRRVDFFQWSILRNKYTAAWMLDVSGSFSPCRLECFLKALYVAKVEEHGKLQQLPGKTSASGVSVYILAVI
ncbi:hypothetical protein HID58_060331 [Brassica napus]|uniref:Uncharacterized protein n=1 Tax=Brassica napus TaxID=3708 RepID=A0ABQ7ZVE9_BRANA|nr:hypothetical protein HID58_060331 [Brassica napus]